MEISGIRPYELSDQSKTSWMSTELNYEDITLIWLDANSNSNFDCFDTKCHLNTIVHYLKVFDDPDEAIDCIRASVNEHIFFIVSGLLSEMVLPQIYDEFQLKVIYIFCLEKEKYVKRAHSYEKVSGIFVDKYKLFHHLMDKIQAYEKTLTITSIFARRSNLSENSIQDYVTEGNVTLAWLKVFFDVLLQCPLDKSLAKTDMLNECRSYYKNNSQELEKIDHFERDYSPDTVINWYTRDSFVYRLVNRALRTRDIDIIFKFRFFIIDLYEQLKNGHASYIKSSSLMDSNQLIRTVYRSQRLGQNELEKLKESVDSIICPISFFSTTTDFPLAYSFIEGSSGSECVIFQIDIPESYYQNVISSLPYTRPFLRVNKLSQFQNENEVIFAMGAVFRIESVEEFDILYVCLKLEEDQDFMLDVFPINPEPGRKVHDWQSRTSADDRIILLAEQLPESTRSLVEFYIKYGMFANDNHAVTNETFLTYRKGFDLLAKCLPGYQSILAIIMYLSVGSIYRDKGELFAALQFGETALSSVKKETTFSSDPILICYNYLAVIHLLEERYTEALSIYEQMLSIATLQCNTSALLAIYIEIGYITLDHGNDDYRFLCLNKIKELKQMLNCEDVAETHLDFGDYYQRRGNFRLALQHYKRSFLCLMNQNTPMNKLQRVYTLIEEVYALQHHYIAALHMQIRRLQATILRQADNSHVTIARYKTLIHSIRRLLKYKHLKAMKNYLQLIIGKTPASIIFKKYIGKIRFLFYFGLDDPILLQTYLKQLLIQVETEYENQLNHQYSLRNLQHHIKRCIQITPSCFAKIYHHAQVLHDFLIQLTYYRTSVRLIHRAYFSNSDVDSSEKKAQDAYLDNIENEIGKLIFNFAHSSHATLCQDRVLQKLRPRHRAPFKYRYRFCGCYKNASVVFGPFTRRWRIFSII